MNVAQNAGRDREHDFGLDALVVVTAEQPTEDRNVAEKRQLAGGSPVLVADQTGEQLVLAILEAQHAGRRARADLVGDGAVLGGDLVDDVADFERHLHRHFVVEIDRRFDVEFQADIDVGDRFGRETNGQGRGDVRYSLANQDLGLFPVARANAWVGEQVDIAVELIGTDGDRAHRDANRRRIQVAQILHGQTVHRQCPQRDCVRPVNPQRLQARALDLENLDFEHHLGFRNVLQRNHLVGQTDRFRTVADQ
ncbi:MAG: hypothetical protein AW09_004504 [Candidatus Accumulibacter phosphatis]|uniref:Uncharacterized protein n=1 Tax=Candidatus Accumulibacter phosphatis TaxID=327160 RepID=A0A084Y6R4_9PROT|nr:MAG: hypothetical protein AW09_004504 [Candidatus Accumulibacter phosphatis]